MRNIMTFNGINNKTMGVYVTQRPPMITPEERGEAVTVPGRDGTLWISEHALEEITITVEIWVSPDADISAVRKWLSGSGELSFGKSPEWCYRARIKAGVTYAPLNFEAGYNAAIPFICQPYRYKLPAETQTITRSPAVLTNPCNAAARPIITVYGTGNITLAIGGADGYAVSLTGISGSITIDSQMLEAYQGTTLLNNKMEGEFPMLMVGDNGIAWTGNVSKIEVRPNWRWV